MAFSGTRVATGMASSGTRVAAVAGRFHQAARLRRRWGRPTTAAHGSAWRTSGAGTGPSLAVRLTGVARPVRGQGRCSPAPWHDGPQGRFCPVQRRYVQHPARHDHRRGSELQVPGPPAYGGACRQRAASPAGPPPDVNRKKPNKEADHPNRSACVTRETT